MPPSPKGEGLWAVKGRPYRTCKRLSGEYRRGRFQTGPPSMGKFPGYGGRGTPQGGLSRPSADSPSASALRDSKKRIQSRNRSALSHRAKLCQTARRGRRALHGALSVGPDDPAGRGKRNACVIRTVPLIRPSVRTGAPSPRGRLMGGQRPPCQRGLSPPPGGDWGIPFPVRCWTCGKVPNR